MKQKEKQRFEKSDAYSLADLPAGYAWNDQRPADGLALLWAYWPQLQAHAAEIATRPEMGECWPGSFVNIGPMFGEVYLADLLECWCAPAEGNPWLPRLEDGRCLHLFHAVFGVGQCCYGSCAVDMETGKLHNGFRPNASELRRKPEGAPFHRTPRRKTPQQPASAASRATQEPYNAWLHRAENPSALAYSIADPGRRLENPTMQLHEVVSHFLPHPPVVVHVPHLSAHVPLRGHRLLPYDEVVRAAEACADWYMDELLPAVPGVVQVLPRVSRLVVDVTRSADDPEVIPTRLPDGRRLRPAEPDNERRDMLTAYHRQHHNLLNLHLNTSLEMHNSARLLTLQGVGGEDQPDVCIAFNPAHIALGLDDALCACCARHGFSYRVKAMLHGVPEAYRGNPRVVAGHLYIRRDLYLDESNHEKKAEGFRRLQDLVVECAKAIHEIYN